MKYAIEPEDWSCATGESVPAGSPVIVMKVEQVKELLVRAVKFELDGRDWDTPEEIAQHILDSEAT